MPRSKAKARSGRTSPAKTVRAQPLVKSTPVPTPPVEPPSAVTSPGKIKTIDKLNIFFAVFGVVAVVAGLLTHALLIIMLVGFAYIATFVIIALIEKSIKWSAWRVIIAIVVVAGLFAIQHLPPKVESFQVDMYNFTEVFSATFS